MLKKNVFAILLMVILTIFTPDRALAVYGEVLITAGGEKEFCDEIGRSLTEVVNALEGGDLKLLQALFTEEGYKAASDVLKSVPMCNAKPVHDTKLLKLPRGGYEVRDIKVKVEMGETPGNPYQYLVFTLNDEGKITDLRFALEKTNLKPFIEEGVDVQDFAFRQRILQTVEIFRTAYNRKDIEYLKQVYSDNALIIVGRVLKERTDLPDMLETSKLSRDNIQFIKRSKAEYIEALSGAFQRNAFVRVVFDSVEVSRHNDDPYLYGVTLKQHWHSSLYSDTGYVFLLWDFKNEENPTIYVRSWQPTRFADGSIIDLYQFEIMRSDE